MFLSSNIFHTNPLSSNYWSVWTTDEINDVTRAPGSETVLPYIILEPVVKVVNARFVIYAQEPHRNTLISTP